jgi:hypothetical protein
MIPGMSANPWELVVTVRLYSFDERVSETQSVTRQVVLAVSDDPETLAPMMHKLVALPAVESPMLKRRDDSTASFKRTAIASLVLLALQGAEST